MAKTPFIKTTVNHDIAKWLLNHLKNSWIKPKRVVKLAVGEVAKLVKDNFKRLNAERSKHGHNFYKTEGVDKTTTSVSDDGATGIVKISSVQMAHKLKGGTVKPRRKFLAIPVSEWAKWQKKTPGDIYGIDLFNFGKGAPFLARTGKDGQPLHHRADWILVRSVTHRPHPEVIPPRRDIDAVVRTATRLYEDYVETQWLKNT